jgi:hypothetical protein
MSNKAKHVLRSHKTYSNNYSIFRGFENKAIYKSAQKQSRITIGEKLSKLFKGIFRKHQDK